MIERTYTLPPIHLTPTQKALAELMLRERDEVLAVSGDAEGAVILAVLWHALRNAREDV